jgi:hypothetical protein
MFVYIAGVSAAIALTFRHGNDSLTNRGDVPVTNNKIRDRMKRRARPRSAGA